MTGDAARLMELFRVDAKHRDDAWRDRLNAAFWPAKLGSFTPHVMHDRSTGFNSFRLGRDERDGGEAASEPAGLVDYALGELIGLVLWPSDEPQPLWSFSIGDLLSYRLYGTAFAPRFWNEPPDRGGAVVFAQPENVRVGTPNEEMFPAIVRHTVRRVMRERLGVREPKVMLIQRPGHGSRLVFNLDPDDLGGAEATDLAFTKLAWCIPSCIPVYRIDSMIDNEAMVPF